MVENEKLPVFQRWENIKSIFHTFNKYINIPYRFLTLNFLSKKIVLLLYVFGHIFSKNFPSRQIVYYLCNFLNCSILGSDFFSPLKKSGNGSSVKYSIKRRVT